MFYGSRGNRLRMSNIPDESDNSNAVWLVWGGVKFRMIYIGMVIAGCGVLQCQATRVML